MFTDLENPPTFTSKHNSLLVSGLLPKELHRTFDLGCETPNDKITNNLGLISGLYIYTNTPPHGYGSQGPKVVETVKRAYDYNKKKSNKVLNVLGIDSERLHWEESDGAFPYNETHGNFISTDVKNMAMTFLKENVIAIDSCVEQTMQKCMHSNSDVLTKGRQTLDCFTHQSVTASVAYQRVYEFYRENLGVKTLNCFEWIKCFFDCMNLPSLNVKGLGERNSEEFIYDDELCMRISRVKTKRGIIKRVIPSGQVRSYMVDCARSFASYIKHKERGKPSRRAIASANMFLRMFLYIIEEFHLELGKIIKGSTISIGGEQKKAKIISNLMEASLTHSATSVSIQGTEDATKWNECLSPSLFALMHKTFFDEEVRDRLGLRKPSEFGKLFSQLALSAHLIMSVKRVQMGPGPLAISKLYYNRLDWKKSDLKRFNSQNQKMLEFARNKIDEENYLLASPGMLMGMLNAGSTTLGLLAVGYGLNTNIHETRTLRSSDDSTTLYVGSTPHELFVCIETQRKALALMGINLSLAKTFFYPKYYSEFTSWYQDGGFVSQFGVETSAIRPQGKNPPDDFYGVAKSTSTGLSTLTFNHLGAAIRIVLGISGVRRLWRIERNPVKRDGISPKVLLLSDGGMNLWDSSNCHLDEYCMREKFVQSEADKEYLLRVINPSNPFIAMPMEEVSYSKVLGKLVTTEVETPRTVFHFIRRSNRTVNNSFKKTMFDQEKICGEATKIVKTVIPTTLIKYPTDVSSMSNHLIAVLSLKRGGLDLNENEEREFRKCIERLQKGGIPEDEDDESEEVHSIWDD